MFRTFDQKAAHCQAHQKKIQFLNIKPNQQIGDRALCVKCTLDQPIELTKGQAILNKIDTFINNQFERRTSDIVSIMISEIDHIEREFKQLLYDMRKNINAIKRTSIQNPFEKYHNLPVYTTSNYQELAELIKDHYSQQGECVLTNQLQQSINNSLEQYQNYLLDIQSVRKYISQVKNSISKPEQFVQLQICQEICQIECHKDTTFQTLLESFELNQGNNEIKYYNYNNEIESLYLTLRQAGFQQQFPLIMKRQN